LAIRRGPREPRYQAMPSKFKTVLVEGAVVALGGALLAWACNALSPRGLALTRNYFPGATRPPKVASPGTNTAPVGAAGSPAGFPADSVAARLQARQLRVVDRAGMETLFRDPRRAQGLVVIVDARDDAQYQAGHIPGAHQLDHYRAPAYLPTVLPVCLNAEAVVVYCHGGDCEDAEFAATLLHEAGVPLERLAVYVGGFSEWATNNLPVERGAHRGSPAGGEVQ